MKSNRPVNLPLSQVISVNAKSPIAIASILHRVSGIVLFLLTPVMLFIIQTSLTPDGFETIFNNFVIRFIAWIFVAGVAYHFVMGIKHLLADMGMNEELKSGRTAAVVSFIVAAVLIAASFVWVVL